MKIVSTSYVNTNTYNNPEAWLERISFYTGLLEELAKHYTVESIEQINYNGKLQKNKSNLSFSQFQKKETLLSI
jgi:hypothetical protein